MIETSLSTPILPPRPNLGPEPLGEPRWPVEFLAIVLVLLVLLGVLAWRLRLRREKFRRKPRTITPESTIDREADVSAESTELPDLVRQCRRALVARFGNHLGARTTEEIGKDPELAEHLGHELVGELVQLLQEADRIKFAGISAPVASEHWRRWASHFVTEVGRDPENTGNLPEPRLASAHERQPGSAPS